jgi:ribose-phosphate pyrophosphokinase
MQNNIKILLNGKKLFSPELKIFSGGEVNVRIPDIKGYPPNVMNATIFAKISSSDIIIAVIQLADALRRRFPYLEKLYLEMPYAPYARQDRVCNTGESLSSKVFADMINFCNFDKVVIYDAHSEVMPALLNKCKSVGVLNVITNQFKLDNLLSEKKVVLVAPDFGSTKKIEKIAEYYNHTSIIQGVKHRDLQTGVLSGFGYYGEAKHKDLLIVDDICDGGGTFVGLANKLRDGGAKSISLFVTHGIFSRGYEYLLDNGIDVIYTTNSLHQKEKENVETLEII